MYLQVLIVFNLVYLFSVTDTVYGLLIILVPVTVTCLAKQLHVWYTK